MSDTKIHILPLFAGTRPDGAPVVEEVRATHIVSTAPAGKPDAKAQITKHRYRLVSSPAFVKGLASGDEVAYDASDNSFELMRHSGNLCVRVYAQANIEQLADDLAAEWAKLGGERDFLNDRMCVLSVHVSCGFKEIEAILNRYVGGSTQSVWYYGNVYDPEDGVTPLNWWQELAQHD